MQDFNDYVKNSSNGSVDGIGELVKSLASKYDGKSPNELMSAIYKEALKGKQNGTLTDADIDGFAATIAPFLDGKKKKYLYKITEELKKI